MRVLHIVTWFTEYKAKTLREGVFHIEQVKYQNSLIDASIYFPFDKSIPKSFIKEDIDGIIVYRSKIRFKFLKYFYYIYHFKKIMNDFHPDCIHAHVAQEAGKITYMLSKLYHIPYIVTEHNPIEYFNINHTKKDYNLKKIYTKSKYNICVSDYQTQFLKNEFSDLDFNTICNGVYPPEVIMNKSYLINKDAVINCCIVAAFYDKYIKGFQFLLPAIKILLDEGFSIKLHICGGGEFYEYYKSYAEQLNIINNCIFYGQCTKDVVYSIINQCNFLVSASLFESAGVSIEEALLLGKPVLITKSGGANSLVTDRCAVIVDKGSTEQLVYGFKKIINDLNCFDSDFIKLYAHEKFDIQVVNKGIINIYNKIII